MLCHPEIRNSELHLYAEGCRQELHVARGAAACVGGKGVSSNGLHAIHVLTQVNAIWMRAWRTQHTTPPRPVKS